MGLDTSLQFYAGVSMRKLCPAKLKRVSDKIIKYHPDTGKPYPVNADRVFAVLVNGQEIELQDRCNKTKLIENYFEKLGFERGGTMNNFFNGVVGIEIGKGESVSGAQTVSLPAPDSDDVKDAVSVAKGLFETAGFSKEIVDSVQLYAVMDASY